jgi:uncharacterized protein with HEPN domain
LSLFVVLSTERTTALLWDALRAMERCRRFAFGRSFDEYLADDMPSSAIERQLEIVGEALAALRRFDPSLAARIPDLQRAVGFRNILIHGYASVDHQVVWEVVQLHLPKLEVDLRRHLPPVT